MLFLAMCVGGGAWGVDGVGCPCPPVRNDIVTPSSLVMRIRAVQIGPIGPILAYVGINH